MEKIHFTTEDGVRVIGNYWAGIGERAVVLLHMMPATKESWNEFAERLNSEGFDVLAIDLRGHGESVRKRDEGGELDHGSFDDDEHRDSRYDLIGAREWLAGRDIQPETVYVGGASIGANLALEYMGEHTECPGGFLLSPGLNYRGIEAVPLAKGLTVSQRVFVAAARDDGNVPGAAEQAEEVFEALASDKAYKIFETGGHGTDLLSNKELREEIVGWLLADVRD